MKTYITITDPQGGTIGYDINLPVPINHTVLVENKTFYGFESSTKLFNSVVEQSQLLSHAAAQPSGSTGKHGSLAWSVVKQQQ